MPVGKTPPRRASRGSGLGVGKRERKPAPVFSPHVKPVVKRAGGGGGRGGRGGKATGAGIGGGRGGRGGGACVDGVNKVRTRTFNIRVSASHETVEASRAPRPSPLAIQQKSKVPISRISMDTRRTVTAFSHALTPYIHSPGPEANPFVRDHGIGAVPSPFT